MNALSDAVNIDIGKIKLMNTIIHGVADLVEDLHAPW
jgi:hypothetical protein